MALEDPRDRGTRGQRTSESRTGPRDRSSGGGGGGNSGIGGVTISRVKKGVGVPGDYPTGPLQEEHIRTGPTIKAGSTTDSGFNDFDFNARFTAVKKHQQALRDFLGRPNLGRVVDFVSGPLYDENMPVFDNPHSWSNGTWHSSTNVPGVVGMVGGMLAGVPMGGVVGSYVGDALNVPKAWHGGSGPNSWADPAAAKAPGGGLLGGGGPSRQQDNRGAQNATGILGVGNQQAPAAATPLTAALPAQQQAAAIKKRAYDFGIGTVPGPSPYSFTTARWL